MLRMLNEYPKCPHCGSTKITEETRTGIHCNGHWNEIRKFSCSQVVRFSPNFMKVIVETARWSTCTYSKQFQETRKETQRLHQEILELIAASILNDKEKHALIHTINTHVF